MIAVSPKKWDRVNVPRELREAVEWVADNKELGFVNKDDVVRHAIRDLLAKVGYCFKKNDED